MYQTGGIKWKMNPPLRAPKRPEILLEDLKSGRIDWIETDHAPHTLDEKVKDPFMSGIPGLPWWKVFEEFLRYHGFSDKRIEEVTFSKVLERFKLDIKKSQRKIKDRRSDYPFNPYETLEKTVSY